MLRHGAVRRGRRKVRARDPEARRQGRHLDLERALGGRSRPQSRSIWSKARTSGWPSTAAPRSTAAAATGRIRTMAAASPARHSPIVCPIPSAPAAPIVTPAACACSSGPSISPRSRRPRTARRPRSTPGRPARCRAHRGPDDRGRRQQRLRADGRPAPPALLHRGHRRIACAHGSDCGAGASDQARPV